MVSRITTFAFEGVEARPVDVQVQLTSGAPSFSIVGLPDKAVAESRERVRAALVSLGLALPAKRIVVNLAPADLPKEGSHFDLPIALGLLTIIGAIPSDALEGYAAMGELALDGRLTPSVGTLPGAIGAEGLKLRFICPIDSGSEAAWSGNDVIAAPSLIALLNHFTGTSILSPAKPGDLLEETLKGPDLREIRGQESSKRALEIAAAGGHNMMMIGPPGSGKSMLAACLSRLMPPLSANELLEVSQIHSLAGLLQHGRISRQRPFRSPHHSASMAAMVGGGIRAQPGEASLAHHGVLFLDELPEFPAQVLDSLRQPMEAGEAVVARANRHVRYPSRFQLIAAANPCKCGGGPAEANCRLRPRCQADYMRRLSGPFLDRIDLFASTLAVSASDLSRPPTGEDSAQIAPRIAAARQRQAERYEGAEQHGRRTLNADADNTALETLCHVDADGLAFLTKAAERLSLSARGYHRVQKVARTIADLDADPRVRQVHVAEALSYRYRPPDQTGLPPSGTQAPSRLDKARSVRR